MEERAAKVKQARSKQATEGIHRYFNNEVEPDNKPLFVFENTRGQPYINEIINVSDIWKEDRQEARLKLQTIDYHIKKELEIRGWKPTTTAYRDIIKEVFKELRLSKHVANIDVMSRLYYYFHLKNLAYG